MSWPFLARPSDDPGYAVGLLSLRLETTWFSTIDEQEDGGNGNVNAGRAAESPSSEAAASSAGSFQDWGQASGGRRGPEQWDEEKAVLFIQVRRVVCCKVAVRVWYGIVCRCLLALQ